MSYDKYIVTFSGGKDSTACFLHLLELGVPKSKIELWHHDVDGESGHFFDWPITKDYCRSFAEAFDVPIYFSWKQDGLLGEILRDNEPTKPVFFETPEGELLQNTGTGKLGTRLKFPQVSPDLSVRWCSPYLKIDVCAAAIANQYRFNNQRTLVLSGERGEESSARAKYQMLEADKADNRFKGSYMSKRKQKRKDGSWSHYEVEVTVGANDRHVDRWRPVRDWTERQVWDIIERYGVRVHPCYYLGYSRCSCMHCIFGNADQVATSNYLDPNGTRMISKLEEDLGVTIRHKDSIADLLQKGNVYQAAAQDRDLAAAAMDKEYVFDIIMEPGEWYLPAGAFGDGCGPS